MEMGLLLTKYQRKLLLLESCRREASMRLIARSYIILCYDEFMPKRKIAFLTGHDIKYVRKWISRWEKARLSLDKCEKDLPKSEDKYKARREYRSRLLEVFLDAPRSGTPPKFSAEEVVQIVSVACESLAETDAATSYRTHQEVARETEKRGIVKSISRSSIARFLKSGGC